jgi:hypothetical protein
MLRVLVDGPNTASWLNRHVMLVVLRAGLYIQLKPSATVVRDLQKELLNFVPPSLLRKRNAPGRTEFNAAR